VVDLKSAKRVFQLKIRKKVFSLGAGGITMIHGTMIHGYCQRIADPTAASNLGDEPELLAKERAQATRAPAKANKEEQRLEERLKGLNFLLWKLSARRRTLLRAKANMDLMGRSLRRLSRPPSKRLFPTGERRA